MNKGIFRLVFDAQRGMRVPAAECTRGCGKSKTAQGSKRHRNCLAASVAAAVSTSLVSFALMPLTTYAARPLPGSATQTPQFNLPQAAATFNQLGRATQGMDAANAQRLVVNQQDQRVILNWSSFDIGAGYSVKFNQPTGGSALNRIGSSSPSVILGSLEANAEVILYNANGMLFGKGATVNTGNFIATTLNIADDQFAKGFRNITTYGPAFQGADGEKEGFVRVEGGASINAAPGGDIMLFAPRVLNEGRLAAPGGQVVLAAGQKVYLAASINPSERGLLVEVDPFSAAVTGGDRDYNSVENAARGSTPTLVDGQLVQRINEIVTERGSISLVGLSVKQMGTARATTAVKGQNGAIYLLAHGQTTSVSHANGVTGQTMAAASELGELIVGTESVTRVDPEASSTTQLDAEPFYNSIVRLEGKQVHLQGNAQIIAPGAGSLTPTADAKYQETKRGVSILASANPLASGAFGVANAATADDSRIVIDPGVLIDVSGANVDLPMSRNVLTGRLFSIQLADMPLQRTGVLYRQEISFDRRRGAKVADVSDFYSQVGRTAAEKLTGGGSIAIKSDGAVVVGQGSKLDVSGGSLRYAGGEIKTTQLRKGNQVVDISDARPDVVYDEVMTTTRGRYETAYVEGKNAGELTVAGRQVVLDGTLSGGVQAGRYQRGGAAGARPLAGRLQVGIVAGPSTAPDYYVNNLVLSQTGAAALTAEFFANPFNAAIPAARAESTSISAQALMDGGFGRVDLWASDVVRIASGTALKLGAGGTLTATARRIEIDGTVSAPSGAIALNAQPTVVTGDTPAADAGVSVVFSSSARLSTAGEWVNDSPGTVRDGAAGDITTPVATGGGSIKVAAYDSVLLPAGAALDVSAGAWRNAAGKLSYGKAGAINLAANVATKSPSGAEAGVVQLDGAVSGYGFTGGGSFTLSSLGITVSDAAAGGLWLTPAFFSANGFETITLKSLGDLTIADNTHVTARLRNRALNVDSATQASGQPISAITHVANVTEVDAVARRAVNLSFAATRLPATQAGVDGASLVIGRGATVATEAGGSLSFSAGKNLTVAGTLQAPGGKISLTVEGARGGSGSDPDKIGFLPTQALWLTDTAKILAGGTVEYAYNLTGLRTGTVYGGGAVTLNAKRGYLVAEAGSLIDISGYETAFDLYGGRVSALISRSAGSLAASSPEGIFVDSTIQAAAPSPRALGGALALSISRQGQDNFTEGAAYPAGERKIAVQQAGTVLSAGLHPGDDLAAAVGNGIAAVSAQAIESAGFAAVSLRADDRIEFAQNVALSASRSLELNTRVIAAQGNAAVSLAAPYVALGDKDIQPIAGMAEPAASSGAASLTVTADLIDLVGTLGLQGISNTRLNAARNGRQDGEIRLRGRAPLNGTAQTGALRFAGALDLTAGQITPTTFSTFEIAGLVGNSILRTHAPGGGSTSILPLSAFGDVKLSANTIEHGGVIRTPFGRLELNALDTLSLLADSELSTSGNGLNVPVGTAVNGTSWYYYPLGTAVSDRFRAITELPVAKQVLLNAGTLTISPTARVSAAGGGDVQAAEFISGAGGLTDYLASTPGLYAVLPGYSFAYAPFDAQIQAATQLMPGEQIVITMAGSALAPGRYTLLPAAYALLPGAVLVSKASDQGSSVLSSALALTDGSTVVTGYRTANGTATTSDDYQRYLIEPSATFRAKSEYKLVSGNDFFTKQAARLGTGLGNLPRDAGRISLTATHLLDWKALFDLSAPAGSKAGEFDLAVPDIVLVNDGQAPSVDHTAADGYTVVSTESLTATGAGSILLGGTRSGVDTAVAVATVSDHLRVETDVQGKELLFAAKKEIVVADNVDIVADGAAGTAKGQLNLSGDGALLRVSNRTGVDIVRTGVARAAGFGDMVVGANARFSGAQVDVDTTGHLSLDSTAVLAANSFGLGAGRIAFSGPSPEGDSVVIDGTLLASVRAANSLSLRSYSTIDFLDSLNLALVGNGRLLLDAAGLRGLGDAADRVNLSAGEVLLRNSSGDTLTAGGQGTLDIEAHPPLRDGKTGGLEIGGGSQSLGFDQVTLTSKGDMTFSGIGQLNTQGNLDLAAQRVTGSTGADQKVTAGGVLTVSRSDGGHTLGERVGLGAKLALTGQRVVQNGTIDLPGGQLSMTALNDANAAYGIEFSAGSITRAGGFSETTPDGWQVFGDAGSIAVTSQQGAIKVDGVIGVAALAGGGSAGQLTFSATGANGTLDLGSAAALEGAAGADGKGGTFVADLQALPDDTSVSIDGLDGLAGATRDFTRKFGLRVRTGNVALAAQQLKAETVSIAADAGSLTVNSTIDASAPQGGVVQLAARDDVTLGAGGRILANSTRAGANGGDVLLASTTGFVNVAAGSTINAGGDDAQDGRVVLRAARDASTVNVAPIAGTITAGEISIEAVKAYSGFTALKSGATSGASLGQDAIASDNTAFMTNQAVILASLGVAGDARFHLRPGVQVDAAGDFTVTNDWNLYSTSRPGGEPGFLTLRAAGNLNVNGTISDGFNGVARNSVLQPGDAWSLRLVAGADLGAANPLAVNRNLTGDLTLAGGKLLRTTSGSIELAAGRDVVLGGTTAAPATVMVTGTPSVLAPALAADFTAPSNAVFTARGGRLVASAGRDLKSPVSDQTLVNNWFWRSGRLSSDGSSFVTSLAWWSRFDLFRQSFGSFGGGNIALNAGRNIQDVSAVAPSSARLASLTPDTAKLVIENGGDIEVSAGGNIAGGTFFAGRGQGSLKAGDRIIAGTELNATIGSLAPVLALMDGGWNVRARSDAAITAAFNPTVMAPNRNNAGSFFYTYGADASLDIASTAGDFAWRNVTNAGLNSLAAFPTGTAEDLLNLITVTFQTPYIAPPNVRIAAHAGDVSLDGNSSSALGISFYPAAAGNLELYAGGDIALNTSLRVMDNSPANLAGVTNPVFNPGNLPMLGLVGSTIGYEINKLVFTNLHAGDNNPLRIHAQGSLTVVDGKKIISPKQAVITAGQDITNLSLFGQHHRPDDLTLISAGRNFINNTVLGTNGLISLAGPGSLKINAGRQLSLGASAGVETVGNLYNTTLPSTGASVKLAAGLDASLDAAGLNGFLNTYLAESGAPSGANYRDELVNYVKQTLKQGDGVSYGYADALNLLKGFSEDGQITFVKTVLAQEFARSYLAPGKAYAAAWEQAAADAGVAPDVYAGKTFERMRDDILFNELKLAGIAGSAAKGAVAKEAGYAPGYKAIELASYAAPFGFTGNIDLIESKVQTKSGGGIKFFAPGGGVNVGLSADVSSVIGQAKSADQRGVVAFAGGDIQAFMDREFLVNAQKVFVIGNGDILLWSSNGNIDSGKGSNNTVTVPPLVPKINPTDGSISFELPTLATGSGIGILAASDSDASGAAFLFAPRGEVIALDAFIRAPSVVFDPEKIRGADNVIGVSVNPVSAPAVAGVAGLGSASNPNEAQSTGNQAPKTGEREKNSILTVEVLAMGDGSASVENADDGDDSDPENKKKKKKKPTS
ncbi:MAG: filamentous hemagglutinin family protein [Gallionella sp.]|nr:filamentous hemagglutinin family protein [Gallionella sp.]